MAPSEPAARHRLFAGTFSDRVRGTADWDVPAPVAASIRAAIQAFLREQ